MSYRRTPGNVKNISPISVSENGLNLHSILSETEASVNTETYRRIINQAKTLGRQTLNLNRKTNVTSLRGGSLINSETESVIGKFGNYSTSSEFMRGGNPIELSATSSAFMTEVMGKSSGAMTGGNIPDLSATSSAFMTEIMANTNMVGGARKPVKKAPAKLARKAGQDANPEPIKEEDSETLSSSSTLSSSEEETQTKSESANEPESETNSDSDEAESSSNSEPESDSSSSMASSSSSPVAVKSTNGSRYITGVRYLMSDTEMSGGSATSETSLSTEDLTLFNN